VVGMGTGRRWAISNARDGPIALYRNSRGEELPGLAESYAEVIPRRPVICASKLRQISHPGPQ
jgi:hypothetical protein